MKKSDLEKKYGYNLTRETYTQMFNDALKRHRLETMDFVSSKAARDAQKQAPARVAPAPMDFTGPAGRRADRQTRIIMSTMRKNVLDNFKKAREEHRSANEKELFYKDGVPTLHRSFADRLKGSIARVMDSFINPTPGLGMPGALAGIVSTETSSSINDSIDEYINNYREKHPEATMFKTWIQRPELSMKPRKTHAIVHKKTIRYEAPFKVPNGKGGFDWMDRPHAANAPLHQICNCNCILDFKIK